MDITKHMRSVHNLYIKILCNELVEEGIPIEESLAAAQLPMDFMGKDEGMVSFHEYQCLEVFARERSGKPWLGLDIGKKIITHHHGPLGYLIASSPDLKTAIASLVKFVVLRTQLLELKLEQGKNETRLLIFEKQSLQDIRIVFMESFLMIIINVLQAVHGKDFKGLRLELNYEAPEYVEKYTQAFSCPMTFGCKSTAVVFESTALTVHNIMADAKAFRLAEIECQNLYDNLISNSGLKNKIASIILDREGEFPSLNEVAEQLNLSKSTLIRKLTKANTSFKEIVDDIRHELASYYLLETELGIESIAAKLGYQDTSNFSRVFKRWYDMTPSQYRSEKYK